MASEDGTNETNATVRCIQTLNSALEVSLLQLREGIEDLYPGRIAGSEAATEISTRAIARAKGNEAGSFDQVKELCEAGYGNGDYVTRRGTDVHLVMNMSIKWGVADFVCVVAPESGWTSVGEVENNLLDRYKRVSYQPPTT